MSSNGVVTVFLSSTWRDLQAERRALEFVLAKFDETKLVGMEHFGSRPDSARNVSLDEVDRCDLFVGILGERYGSGIVDAEIERAVAKRIPCLFYVKVDEGEARSASRESQLAAVVARVRTSHLVSDFRSADELATQVAVDLHKWLVSRHLRQSNQHDLDPRLAQVADRVRQAWVTGVLGSIAEEHRIRLGTAAIPSAVRAQWSRHVAIGDGRGVPATPVDTVAQIFADASRALLILGQPGSGKTVTLVELTRDLLHFRDARLETAVPVVLPLKSWGASDTDFADWAVKTLRTDYFVPEPDARPWLDGRRLYLMLDGLDEVPLPHRSGCVEAINAFIRDGRAAGVAVTCRLDEYEQIDTPLALYHAIQLLPIEQGRVAAYLETLGPSSAHLRARIAADSELRELATNPLMLSVMVAAFQQSTPTSLSGSGQPLRERLFGLYVSSMFARREVARDEERRTVAWLSWLAMWMRRQSWPAFSLDCVQPCLLGSVAARAAYAVGCAALSIGIALGQLMQEEVSDWAAFPLLVGAFALVDFLRLTLAGRLHQISRRSGGVVPYLVWLPLYLLVPLASVRYASVDPDAGFTTIVAWAVCSWPLVARGAADDVRLLDRIGWNWTAALRGVLLANVIGSLLGQIACSTVSIFGESSWQDFFSGIQTWVDNVARAPSALFVAPGEVVAAILRDPVFLIASALGGAMGGIKPRLLSGVADPYSRLRATFVRSLIGLGLFFAVGWLLNSGSETPSQQFRTAVAAAPIGWVWFGGLELIRHAVARIVLASLGLLPLACVRRLDAAVDLAIMRRRDATYAFWHELLLDHLAGRQLET